MKPSDQGPPGTYSESVDLSPLQNNSIATSHLKEWGPIIKVIANANS